MKGLHIKLLLAVAVLCFSCEVKIPNDIIQPTAMENLLYDYHLAQVMSPNEMQSKLYVDYVFDKHNVTKELFDSSMIWYTRNPRHIYEIYGNLQERLNAEVLALDNDAGTTGVAVDEVVDLVGDTVNLWSAASTHLLSATPLFNRLLFCCKADTTFVVGDSISFAFNAGLIQPPGRKIKQYAHAALVVEYADSSVVGDGCQITASGHYAINIANPLLKDIKEVRGFIYYNDTDSLKEARMLVGDISVIRVHPMNDDEETD